MSDDNPKPPNPEATPQGGDAQPRGDAPAEPKATPQVEPQPRGHPLGAPEAPARGKGKGKGKDTPEGSARGRGKKGSVGQTCASEPEGPLLELATRPRLMD